MKDIVCKGDFSGDVNCTGTIKVKGNIDADKIEGNVVCNSIKCDKVEGNVVCNSIKCDKVKDNVTIRKKD